MSQVVKSGNRWVSHRENLFISCGFQGFNASCHFLGSKGDSRSRRNVSSLYFAPWFNSGSFNPYHVDKNQCRTSATGGYGTNQVGVCLTF